MFDSCEAMLADAATMARTDGVIVCTAHACHARMGALFLAAGKHVLMEKPMTVDVAEARALAAQATAASEAAGGERPQTFMVNNTANFREQCFEARRRVAAGELGELHHALCVMYSPLLFLFDDPANTGWVAPTGSMRQPDGSGNGFGWGQASHALAWVLHVGALEPEAVTAVTHRSARSGADLTDAALVRCARGCSISPRPAARSATSTATRRRASTSTSSSSAKKRLYAGDDEDPTGPARAALPRRPAELVARRLRMENTEPRASAPSRARVRQAPRAAVPQRRRPARRPAGGARARRDVPQRRPLGKTEWRQARGRVEARGCDTIVAYRGRGFWPCACCSSSSDGAPGGVANVFCLSRPAVIRPAGGTLLFFAAPASRDRRPAP